MLALCSGSRMHLAVSSWKILVSGPQCCFPSRGGESQSGRGGGGGTAPWHRTSVRISPKVACVFSDAVFASASVDRPTKQVVSEDLGFKIEKVDISSLGSCKRVTITKDDTILLHGSGDPADIQARCEQIRQSAEATTSDYDRCGGQGTEHGVGL